MIKYNLDIFKFILEAGQYNVPTSQLWILKSEKVFHKGKYFLKIYIHQNETILAQLKGIVFEVKHLNNSSKLSCYEFQKVESLNNENIFGCLIEMPADFNGSEYSIAISSYFLKNDEITEDLDKLTLISLNDNQLETAKNDYLRNHIQNYVVFPKIGIESWQCKCGKFNLQDSKKCGNCSVELNNIDSIIKVGLDDFFYQNYIKDNPFDLDTTVDIETNLRHHFDKFSKYGISQERIMRDINTEDFFDKYIKARPFKYNPKLNKQDCLNEYKSSLEKLGLESIYIDMKITDEIINKEIENTRLSESSKRKKTWVFSIVFVSFIALSSLLYISVLNPMLERNKVFNAALTLIEDGEFSEAINSLEDYSDNSEAKAIVSDARKAMYEKALSIIDEHRSGPDGLSKDDMKIIIDLLSKSEEENQNPQLLSDMKYFIRFNQKWSRLDAKYYLSSFINGKQSARELTGDYSENQKSDVLIIDGYLKEIVVYGPGSMVYKSVNSILKRIDTDSFEVTFSYPVDSWDWQRDTYLKLTLIDDGNKLDIYRKETETKVTSGDKIIMEGYFTLTK